MLNNDPELKEITSQTTKHTYQGQTSWTDHIHKNILNISNPRSELQPLPDYMRWFETCEQHYREREILQHGPWDDVPGIFLPTGVLYVCYSLTDDPPITVQQVTEYYKNIKRRQSDELWEQMKGKKTRELYFTKAKPQLEALCQTLKRPATPAVTKHRLVNMISEKNYHRSYTLELW